jgi:hypothetical protein
MFGAIFPCYNTFLYRKEVMIVKWADLF